MSSATVPTIDEIVDTNPAMASETVADADKLAEEEVRVLAIRCLKHIFSISTGTSRTQMRLATALTLRFITTKERPNWMEQRVVVVQGRSMVATLEVMNLNLH